MRVDIEGEIRGSVIRLTWIDGRITGGRELLDRALRRCTSRGEVLDLEDPVAVIRALEQAAGQHLAFTITPEVGLAPVGDPAA
jgi:hypothetical protein